MKTAFSREFGRLRRQAGFDTAYRFFHASGGVRAFGCSFQNYLRIEKGSHLPRPQRLPLLFKLLRLPLDAEDHRRLVRSYVTAWVGSAQTADWLLAPFEERAAAPSALDPAGQALRRVVRETGKPVTVAQFEALLASPEAYWCHRLLSTSDGSHTAESLSARIASSRAKTEAALKSLARLRLARKERSGAWRSPLAGQFLVFPDSSLVRPALFARLDRYHRDMARRRGRLLDRRFCGVRADLRRLDGYIPHLREAIRSVNAYSVTEATDASALVLVETSVTKLLDF